MAISSQLRADEVDLFMLTLEDDTEDAPWMVMGDLQFDAATNFKQSLRLHADRRHLAWYVASMLPIRYRLGGGRRKHQLAPDCFVAFVPDHPRGSYDLDAEGTSFPPFVLEIVSPSSVERDEEDKLVAYDTLGAQEYALFTPRDGAPSTLAGYRRDESGTMVSWPVEADGSLWSDVLGIRLIVHETLLRAQSADGALLPTLDEAEAALRAEQAALRAEQAARRAAEAEVERLHEEIRRLRGGRG